MSQAFGDSSLPSQANVLDSAAGTQPVPSLSTVSRGIGASSSAVLPSEPWSDSQPFSPSEQWAVLPNIVGSGRHTSGSEGTPSSTSARACLPETTPSDLDYRYRRREIDAGVSIAVANANNIDLETLPPAYEDRDRTENHLQGQGGSRSRVAKGEDGGGQEQERVC
ncbi:uncharacterized protein LAESUDRAFT_757017 [Laetiporus sulphureus 93-53]|uniref:Uncharacterized protein n=1 Tax=Laetiporus sulphureus 93-53 TaxID=1314785 RepID=A0A165FTX8_9APHY|nr:uncharacterized protein LAESUDRAFT_757017 [Laetiporus sulphureus 93-53]KZT09409.1 hypothetical protein LAESUDRAFT_757017 [Laetiporus sulphureus 93-53]